MASPDKKAEAVDWAEIYTTLISHTSMEYDEIGNRTIPQIEAILKRLKKHINIKMGIPNIFGGTEPVEPVGGQQQERRAPKLSEIAAFCDGFRGIRK